MFFNRFRSTCGHRKLGQDKTPTTFLRAKIEKYKNAFDVREILTIQNWKKCDVTLKKSKFACTLVGKQTTNSTGMHLTNLLTTQKNQTDDKEKMTLIFNDGINPKTKFILHVANIKIEHEICCVVSIVN